MVRNKYLFVHFIGESEHGEQVYFSLSEDGLHWNDLNNGQPVLVSDLGEKGVRDPFLVRDEKNGCFYLIATDCRIASGKGWGVAQFEGSKDIIVWKSEDLVHWSKPWNCTVAIEESGCAWAPEAIYDEEKDAFLVFWASMTKLGNPEHKQRIFASYTKDFVTYTEPELYIERDKHVIDTDIIRIPEGYVRFSKDETTKNIRMDFGKTLDKDNFSDVHCPVLDNLYGVEGPIAFPMEDGKKWCLFVDRYAEGKGYLPLISEDVLSGEFRILEDSEYDMGQTLKRHGGILAITEDEYQRLKKAYQGE
ncbi:MAG: 1,4-beta-xylanase [Lachnospiraceae bacterium]|nr:1,4-beta-xylanase [Lachnospiraceae bacterium]